MGEMLRLVVGRIDTVRRPANRSEFFAVKADTTDGGNAMPGELSDETVEALQAVADEAIENEDALVAKMAESLDEADETALRYGLRFLTKAADGENRDVLAVLTEAGLIEKASGDDNDDDGKDKGKGKTKTESKTPVVKATVRKSATPVELPEDVMALVNGAENPQAALTLIQKMTEQPDVAAIILPIVAGLVGENKKLASIVQKFVDKDEMTAVEKMVGGLGMEGDQPALVEVFKGITDDKQREALAAILRPHAEVVSRAEQVLMQESGTSARDAAGTSAYATVRKMAEQSVAKSEGTIDLSNAMRAVWRDRPDLVQQHRLETSRVPMGGS